MWSAAREQGMMLWVRQIVSLSYLYSRASSWYRVIAFVSTLLSVIGTLFSIPSYGCPLVSRGECAALLWSGIIVTFIVGVNNVVASIYVPSSRATAYNEASKRLLRISRTIDSELARTNAERSEIGAFSQRILDEYDAIIDHIPLPWFIDGEQQLANVSLIHSFTQPHARSITSTTTTTTTATSTPAVTTTTRLFELNSVDREIARRTNHELSRLGCDELDLSREFHGRDDDDSE